MNPTRIIAMANFLKNMFFPANDVAGANDTIQSHQHRHEGETSGLLSKSDNQKHYNDGTAMNGNNNNAHGGSNNNLESCYSSHVGTEHRIVVNNNEDGATENNLSSLASDPVLRKLKTATALCCAFMLVEVAGGLLSGSLAVLSDAAHLMADLASFAVAIVAAYLAARPSTSKHTYGLKRSESLAALFSMTCLAIISVGLAGEAVRRIYGILVAKNNDSSAVEDVDGKLMSVIAAIGVVVNIALALVLGQHHVHMPGGSHGHDHSHDHGHTSNEGGENVADGHDHQHQHQHDSHNHDKDDEHRDRDPELPLRPNEVEVSKNDIENVNLRAAYLHVMADLTQSVAVLLAGLVIWYNPEWRIVDPIATILFCCLVFYSTLGVIRSAICVLLEEVPPDVSWQQVHNQIEMLPGVTNVHDLHIWSISHGITAMSVHVQTASKSVEIEEVLKTITAICQANGIEHSTVQVQPFSNSNNDCTTCVANQTDSRCVVSSKPPSREASSNGASSDTSTHT